MDYTRVAVTVLVVGAVICGVFVGTAAADAPNCSTVTYNTDGDGALLVENVDQLQCMNTSLSEDYRLGNDIDASGTTIWNSGKGFEPVGPNPNAPFNGTLDGDGNSVTGLYINRSPNYQGLFGAMDDAVVRNLNIEDVELTNSSAFDVGSLAGQINRTEVYDMSVTGDISVDCCAGGLVGLGNVDNGASEGNVINNVQTDVEIYAPSCCAGGIFYIFEGGNIADTYAEGDVNTSTGCCAGGIGAFLDNDGNFETEVRNTYATGDIHDESCCVGGFVGEIYDSGERVVVENSYATGNVYSNESGCCVGGFSEYIADGTVIRDSHATGNVYSRFCCSGGFAAYIFDNVVIEDSYATGDVTDGNCCVGGFTGEVFDNTVIRDSFSTGNVEGQFCCVGGFFGDGGASASETGAVIRSTSTGNVKELGSGDAGGFAGYNNGINITESYSTGSVESNESSVGGFVGYVTGGAVINKSYARGDATGNDTVGGFVGILNSGEINEAYSVGVPTATNPSATEVGGFIARDETTGSTSIATNEHMSGERGIGTEVSVSENVPSNAPVSKETHPTRNKRVTATTVTEEAITVQETTDSYWDEEASGTSSSDGGTPLSTSQMTGSAATGNMAGFDFTNTWKTVTNDYPILRNSPDLSILRDGRDCIPRRSLGRGQESEACPGDRGLSRGESRRDTDRGYDRGTSRRDRGRDSTRRNRGR